MFDLFNRPEVLGPGEVELSAKSSEEGEGNEVVPADYKGEEMQLGFNWQYLQAFLNCLVLK